MKLTFTLFTLVIASVSAAVLQERDDQDGKDITTLTAPQTLTATKVYPSMVDFEPFMVSMTSEVVWTQFPVPTESASTV
ncbi:hypothetical protein VKT23_020479 [Stygiomarasmius scandens]|uniref:Hepcidin n=1 Tax=Marasmiellus scandens TaxID=2682957 RepID=A0ABR1ILE0_9AGAR